jgi:hypothetical protein
MAEIGCSPGSFNSIFWDGRIDPIDLRNGSQAYLAAWNCSDPNASPMFFSHYFNLTKPTQSTSSDTMSSTASTTVTTATRPSQQTADSSSTSASTNSTFNNAGAIGGGVGGGLGGALLLIAGGFALYRYRKESHGKEPAHLYDTNHDVMQHDSVPTGHKVSMAPAGDYAPVYEPKHPTGYRPSELA